MPEVTKKQSLKLWFLPTVLCFLGVVLLIGCIPIPTPEKVVAGTDYRRVFGKQGEWLVRGETTKQQVLTHLGPPQHEASDGEFLGYYLETNYGFWVQPLCFNAGRTQAYWMLSLQFDHQGRLLRYDALQVGPYLFNNSFDRSIADNRFGYWAENTPKAPTAEP